ncbi:hypothetical protein [Pseudomonas sp. LP_7_YM]|uniref:hypothetical protein n=1 Tax=Pseudomonas sp. LP_7_YM TaxID=2485137 RepID=UPI001061D51E|nr:hypothetical protein [Pseudomonas sp. LP_7_YM]
MTNYTTLVQQLPQRLQIEISAHLGSTAGMSEVQIVSRYRDVAWWLRSVKLATLPANYEVPAGHLSAKEFDRMGGPSPGVAPHLAAIMNEWFAYESAWHLEKFINQLQAEVARLHEFAQQQAQRRAEEASRQLAQRQAEEAARQLAQRQAEEAARLHAQRLAEDAARQLAQRQAEEAARLAARQLAEQQAHAAAEALAQQKAQEIALQEARVALELAAAVQAQPSETALDSEAALSGSAAAKTFAPRIVFIPGPAAMAEINRATLVLKQSIDAAVTQYASAISPYLNAAENTAHAIH